MKTTTQLPQLQVFLHVARRRSFSAAARELGVTPSAVSQAVRQLEEQLGVPLLARTTRSVSLTEAGRRLVENAGPAVRQALAALTEASAQPGEASGRLRLTVPRTAVSCIITPVLPTFQERHPRVEVEVVVDDGFVDIVKAGFDAGVRLTEAIERDMIQVRLTDPFRFVVVGSPPYLARNGVPERPEDLLRHTCITFRQASTGDLYAWELEQGGRTWRVPVRGSVVTNENPLTALLAEQGMGLAYVLEPTVASQLQEGRLVRVLEPYSPTVPGYFLYYPNKAQRSSALRLFVETARELAVRDLMGSTRTL